MFGFGDGFQDGVCCVIYLFLQSCGDGVNVHLLYECILGVFKQVFIFQDFLAIPYCFEFNKYHWDLLIVSFAGQRFCTKCSNIELHA